MVATMALSRGERLGEMTEMWMGEPMAGRTETGRESRKERKTVDSWEKRRVELSAAPTERSMVRRRALRTDSKKGRPKASPTDIWTATMTVEMRETRMELWKVQEKARLLGKLWDVMKGR